MLWTLILAFLFSFPAFAGDDGEAPPVVGGDTTSEWPAVGVLLACSSSWCTEYCSATLVEQNWVVTAAHCVEALDDYDDYGYTNYFGVGRTVNNLDDYAEITRGIEHPQYNRNTLQHDIGLAELRGSGITTVDPMPVNEDSVRGSWVGEELSYVGYGVTSDNANDSGTKRFADMEIYGFDNQFVYTLDVEDGQNVCYGDSGGAALQEVEEGAYELVAVNSYVFGYENNGYACVGGGSGASRLDTHLDFIEDYVEVGPYESGSEDEPETGDDDPGNGSDNGSSSNDDDDDSQPGNFDLEAEDISVREGRVGSTQVLVDGESADDGSFTFTVTEEPDAGASEVDEDGWVTYVPDYGFTGSDEISITVTDDDGNAESIDIDIEVKSQAEGKDVDVKSSGCITVPSSGGVISTMWLLGALGLIARRRE